MALCIWQKRVWQEARNERMDWQMRLQQAHVTRAVTRMHLPRLEVGCGP